MTPEQCREAGGHHWKPPTPGQRNECARCGYQGIVFEPDDAGRCRFHARMAKLPAKPIFEYGADEPIPTADDLEVVQRRCCLQARHDGPHHIEAPNGKQLAMENHHV